VKGRNNTGKFIRGFVSTGDFAFDIYQEPSGLQSTANRDKDDAIAVQISRVSDLPNFTHSSFIQPFILNELQEAVVEAAAKRLATLLLKRVG
jgi:hypothetical protein